MSSSRFLIVLLSLAACAAPPTGVDDAGVFVDAGLDAGRPDAGTPDAGTPDAGPTLDAGQKPPLDAGACVTPSGVGDVFRVRAMASNLSSGNNQSYTTLEGLRMIQGVQPDVVMMQEFNYGSNTPAEFAAFANQALDGGHYFRGSGAIPNGVLSRWPIVDAGEWTDPNLSDRTFVWVQIDLPGPNDLFAISLHLHTKSAASRDQETASLLTQINAAIPEGQLMLVAGDFNSDTRAEPLLTNLGARFVTAGPWPVDNLSGGNTNATRSKPYDWVLASPCLDRNEEPVVLGSHQFPYGLVLDTRVYVPLTEIAPALFGDSSAINMQHMGVVREFTVQP